jgi:rubrerythrin
MKHKIDNAASNVAMFLAHAVELEAEAADRYAELADSMEAHNNIEVATLFRDLSGYSRKHMEEVQGIAAGFGPLPKVAPWEFEWSDNEESPESAAFENTHYLMKPHHALKLAMRCEVQGNKYYAAVAAQTKDPEVAKYAALFAEEEAEHVELVARWLERFPAPAEGWDDDPDPPNVAE